MTWLLVVIGGMVGATLRYVTDRAVQSRHDTVFPWGTFTVNVIGSFVLGVLAGASSSTHVQLLVGTGLCGALTTYSTFSYETLQLAGTGARIYALANLLGTLGAGLGAYFTGSTIADVIRN
ncbi:fluoride efflux transporter CrcB [Nocardia sp. CNY236]|uniref:fluoride efflux transporter CrcB n=1 Tax=Nocardia sp. CNY236 TaxID=1169152 RepID=UPI000423DD95|nr:fluoride efflux transporter CrcB [Nocardia sp. CNY236]